MSTVEPGWTLKSSCYLFCLLIKFIEHLNLYKQFSKLWTRRNGHCKYLVCFRLLMTRIFVYFCCFVVFHHNALELLMQLQLFFVCEYFFIISVIFHFVNLRKPQTKVINDVSF